MPPSEIDCAGTQYATKLTPHLARMTAIGSRHGPASPRESGRIERTRLLARLAEASQKTTHLQTGRHLAASAFMRRN
jgi:hypothetical protein